MTPLRLLMLDAMMLRGFAARTQETYLIAVGQMARYHHCSPELLSDEQIQAYLLYRYCRPQPAAAAMAPFSAGATVNRRTVSNGARIARRSRCSSGVVRACRLDAIARARDRDRERDSHEAFMTAHGNTASGTGAQMHHALSRTRG